MRGNSVLRGATPNAIKITKFDSDIITIPPPSPEPKPSLGQSPAHSPPLHPRGSGKTPKRSVTFQNLDDSERMISKKALRRQQLEKAYGFQGWGGSAMDHFVDYLISEDALLSRQTANGKLTYCFGGGFKSVLPGRPFERDSKTNEHLVVKNGLYRPPQVASDANTAVSPRLKSASLYRHAYTLLYLNKENGNVKDRALIEKFYHLAKDLQTKSKKDETEDDVALFSTTTKPQNASSPYVPAVPVPEFEEQQQKQQQQPEEEEGWRTKSNHSISLRNSIVSNYSHESARLQSGLGSPMSEVSDKKPAKKDKIQPVPTSDASPDPDLAISPNLLLSIQRQIRHFTEIRDMHTPDGLQRLIRVKEQEKSDMGINKCRTIEECILAEQVRQTELRLALASKRASSAPPSRPSVPSSSPSPAGPPAPSAAASASLASSSGEIMLTALSPSPRPPMLPAEEISESDLTHLLPPRGHVSVSFPAIRINPASSHSISEHDTDSPNYHQNTNHNKNKNDKKSNLNNENVGKERETAVTTPSRAIFRRRSSQWRKSVSTRASVEIDLASSHTPWTSYDNNHDNDPDDQLLSSNHEQNHQQQEEVDRQTEQKTEMESKENEMAFFKVKSENLKAIEEESRNVTAISVHIVNKGKGSSGRNNNNDPQVKKDFNIQNGRPKSATRATTSRRTDNSSLYFFSDEVHKTSPQNPNPHPNQGVALGYSIAVMPIKSQPVNNKSQLTTTTAGNNKITESSTLNLKSTLRPTSAPIYASRLKGSKL